MKFDFKNIQLSSKGATVSAEVLHENMKITTHETQFHELVVIENDLPKRVGWLVPNEFIIDADFITHTSSGSKGKSTHDTIERSIILDGNEILTQLLPETLQEVDVTESEEILENMKSEGLKGANSINFDGGFDNDAFAVLSPSSKFVFIQTSDSSIRIHGDDGVYVLKRDGDREKLVIIDQFDGVNVYGDKNISIGPGGLIIDGKSLDLGGIMENVVGSLSALNNLDIKLQGIEDIGQRIGKLGEQIGRNFEKNFEKNFRKNFMSKFEDSMDDFDDDTEGFDVDIDF